MDNKAASEVTEHDVVLYRLKCAKTRNGLSHYIIYGDAPTDKTPL